MSLQLAVGLETPSTSKWDFHTWGAVRGRRQKLDDEVRIICIVRCRLRFVKLDISSVDVTRSTLLTTICQPPTPYIFARYTATNKIRKLSLYW